MNDSSLMFENNGTEYSVCRWWWDGTGILYQVVAGPVFNNLYPLAGIFTGFLADYGSRKIWLTISLVFWSVATGLTGFSKAFWHIVLLRALLAIGYVSKLLLGKFGGIFSNPFVFLSLSVLPVATRLQCP